MDTQGEEWKRNLAMKSEENGEEERENEGMEDAGRGRKRRPLGNFGSLACHALIGRFRRE